MRINPLIHQYTEKIQSEQQVKPEKQISTAKTENGESFEQILQQQLQNTSPLTFSRHAQVRMKERDMTLSAENLEKLDGAIKKAGQKGVRDTLVLLDKMAFVVSVKNNTVITAMNDKDIADNVFTQIDGAVIL